MAKSGTINGSCTGGSGGKYNFWASWVRNSYSVDKGTSNITVSLNVQRNDGYSDSAYNLNTKPSVSLKVNGASKTPTTSVIDTRNSKVCTFATWTGDVTHKDDGTLTCPIVASFSLSGVSSLSGGSLSGNAILDDIPRASTVSIASGTFKMGSVITISISRKSTSFTHDLSYTFGSASGSIKNGVATSHSWTIPDLASYTGGKTSGTMVITCITKNGTKTIGTDTVTFTVGVPAASAFTVDKSVLNFGEKLNFSISKNSTAYTHDLKYALTPMGGGDSVAEGVIETDTDAPKPWEIPATLAKEMPAKNTGYLTVTCTTRFKNSTSEVGKSVKEVTVIVPDNETFRPKISSVALTCVSDITKEPFQGLYIAGKSKVKVKTTASTAYSTIASTTVRIGGRTYSGNDITSDYLLEPGKNDIIVTVKDARGYPSEYSTSIQVIDYASPRLVPVSGQSGIVCRRCTYNGLPSVSGEFLLVKAQRSYYKVISDKQNNFCRLEYRYKTSFGAAFSDWKTLLDNDDSTDSFSGRVDGIVLSNRSSYVVEIRAVDDIDEEPVTLSFKIATAFVTFHLGKGGKRVAIGKVAEEDNLFDVALDTRFEGNVSGRVLGLGKIPVIKSGDNLDALVEPGAYAIATTESAQGINNLPVPYAGLVRVMSANGSGNTTGNWVYLIQEYIPISAGSLYRRTLQTDGTGTWAIGSWYKFSGTKVT